MEGLPNSNQVFSENIKENIVFSKENRSSFEHERSFYELLNEFSNEGTLETLLLGAEKYRLDSSTKKDPCFSVFLSNNQKTSDSEISQYLLMNMMFEVVVVRKDPKEKKLEVFLRKFLCLATHTHDISEEKISQITKALKNEKSASKYLEKIHQYQIFGVIDHHDIKEDFSVFSYFVNFDNVKEKDILTAIIVDKKPGLRLSLRNELIIDCDFFKIHELFEKHAVLKKREKQFYGRLGFTNFSLSSSNQAKPGQNIKNEIFDVDFQIKSDVGFSNTGNYEPMLQKLKVNELSTLHFKSNKLIYQKLKFNYEKF